MRRLHAYQDLLLKWNKSINLVSRQETQSLWSRHIVDSAQLFTHAGNGESWLDLGSGGGLPGLVCAIISTELTPERHFTLVESDLRKTVFLRQAAQDLELKVDVERARIEDLTLGPFDIISARALAPLKNLFEYAHRFTLPTSVLLFLKGQRASDELTDASADWHSHAEDYPSLSHPAGKILKITRLKRRI